MVMGMLGSLVAMTWSYIRRETSMSARRTLFLPLVGSVSAFIIFVFLKAGQLTISSGSGTSLSPFFLSFVGIISGLLSERAYARMESVGTKFFTVDDDNVRWAVRLRTELDESGVSIAELATYLGCEESTAKNIVDELSPANLTQQRLIAACLRIEVRELFTDAPPKGILNDQNAKGSLLLEVPDLLGVTSNEAKSMLARAGLTLGNVSEEFDTSAKQGAVIAQQPPAGQHTAKGSAVALVIAKESENQ
jgi:lambda repressor-like predicted transcriptional regulator